jgi:glucose/arabinose dehydrogenase
MVAVVSALLVVGAAAAGLAPPARADGPPGVKLALVVKPVSGTAIAQRPGDPGIYVTEQAGTVRVVRGKTMAATPVLDISADVSQNGGEQGLLGIAFAPDGDHLYLDYTDRSGTTQVVEYAMRGRAVVAGSRRVLLSVAQPQSNHNGGQIVFGPDGMLYIALGDGGGAGDRGTGHADGGNAQSLATLLGKILRIDPSPHGTSAYTVPADNPFVGQAGARPEIWSYGLRKPWRFTFDAATGDLWIGDVGQNAWEEVDHAKAVDGRDAGRGMNFGWNRLEGTHSFSGTAVAGSVDPVFEYAHSGGACSVVGGYLYRGHAIAPLRGMYVFTDYCSGALRALAPRGNGSYSVVNLGITIDSASTFGERRNGELFVLSQNNGLYRLRAN